MRKPIYLQRLSHRSGGYPLLAQRQVGHAVPDVDGRYVGARAQVCGPRRRDALRLVGDSHRTGAFCLFEEYTTITTCHGGA